MVKKRSSSKRKYICSTCGLVTAASKGHLCSPVILDKAFECEYCGALAGNPRHVCKQKAAKVCYVCDACGRTAVKKSEVCVPTKI